MTATDDRDIMITKDSGINTRTGVSWTGNEQVLIHTDYIAENGTNDTKKFDRPRSKASRQVFGNSPLKYVFDFMKITRTFQVRGHFSTDGSSETIGVQKQRLRDMFRSAGTVTMRYSEGSSETTFTGSIDSFTFIEEPEDNVVANHIRVEITFTECQER